MLDKVAKWRRLKVCIAGGDPPKKWKKCKKVKKCDFCKKVQKSAKFQKSAHFWGGGVKKCKISIFWTSWKNTLFCENLRSKGELLGLKGGGFSLKKGVFRPPRGGPPVPTPPPRARRGHRGPAPPPGESPPGDPPGPPPGWGGGGSTFSLLPRPRRWCAHHLKRKKVFITWKSCEMK